MESTGCFSELDLLAILERKFTRIELVDLWINPLKSFLKLNYNSVFNGVSIAEMGGNLSVKPNMTKLECILFCSKFYTNNEALLAFYKSLPEEHQHLVEVLVWNESVGPKELENIFNKPVFWARDLSNNYRNSFELVADPVIKFWEKFFKWDSHWMYGRNTKEEFLECVNPRLLFPTAMRMVYSSILSKPDGYYLKPIELPKSLTVFQAEQVLFSEIPLFTAYYMQGRIGYSQKGYPNSASIKKMAKLVKIQAFPDDQEGSFRHHLMAGLFSENFKLPSISDSPIKIIKYLFSNNYYKVKLPYFLLKHLKKINIIYIDSLYNASDNILEVIKKLPLEQWVTFENIREYSETHFVNLTLASSYELERLSTDFGLENSLYDKPVNKSNVKNLVLIPNFKGHIYLLAAFGLLDLAIDPNLKFVISPYDRLYGCRLTKLGAYVFGLVKDYTPPSIPSETSFFFDEKDPIIRVEGNVALADTIMANYAVKVSENRYQFSPEKFLKDCKTTKNLEDKIGIFKQAINKILPVFWEEYLKQLVENSKVVKNLSKVEVYRLPANRKELHLIVAQDIELRKLVIKAEQFHVLVYEENKLAFVQRMKELGFLVN
jgi:hypothetical protein